MENKPQFPAEEVTLPSKGLLYLEDSPLRSGKIEMKYMTAREEDILTNQNYIKGGTVIDKLLKSLILTPGFDYNDLLIGDKNAVMVAARILGYGAEYEIKKIHPQTGVESIGTINLSNIKDKEIDEKLIVNNRNEFDFTLPASKTDITFKLLTQKDENKIEREVEGLKKINKQSSEGTVRLKHIILSVNKDYEIKTIRDFVDNNLLAKDARALRQYIGQIQPGIESRVEVEFKDGYIEEDVELPINLSFFWPDAEL